MVPAYHQSSLCHGFGSVCGLHRGEFCFYERGLQAQHPGPAGAGTGVELVGAELVGAGTGVKLAGAGKGTDLASAGTRAKPTGTGARLAGAGTRAEPAGAETDVANGTSTMGPGTASSSPVAALIFTGTVKARDSEPTSASTGAQLLQKHLS